MKMYASNVFTFFCRETYIFAMFFLLPENNSKIETLDLHSTIILAIIVIMSVERKQISLILRTEHNVAK